MNLYLQVALATGAWCFGHSFFVTHFWRDAVCRRIPGCPSLGRLVYVLAATASALVLFRWLESLPRTVIWSWPGWWQAVRAVGLFEAGLLFWLGARAYDLRFFLGLRQAVDRPAGGSPPPPVFSTAGILAQVRHPWYTGTVLFIVFILPFTDVNLVWRAVLVAYTFIGTELEERKLVLDLGPAYVSYRNRVPRFLPVRGKRLRD